MHETYRMLGKEHEADLEREAEKWRRAAEVRACPGPAEAPEAARGRVPELDVVAVALRSPDGERERRLVYPFRACRHGGSPAASARRG